MPPSICLSLSVEVHEFAIRATDAAGDIDLTPAAVAWTVDATPPDTIIDIGPPASTASTGAEFTFHATEEDVVFECRLDGGDWTPCDSPAERGPLAVGTHLFEVRAEDLAGNIDPTPAQHGWEIIEE